MLLKNTVALMLSLAIPMSLWAQIPFVRTAMTIPGTEELQLQPGIDLADRDLSFANFRSRNLTGADFSNANLQHASFVLTTLTDADFSNTQIESASFEGTTRLGFTPTRLYETRSYQEGRLNGISFVQNNHAGWNFAGQDLSGANFAVADLSAADLSNSVLADTNFTSTDLTKTNFADADIRNTRFRSTNVTADQIYSTGSYQQKDLTGVSLTEIESPGGWDFADQNLTDAVFNLVNLEDSIFTNATVSGATFFRMRGLTPEQIYSTANYKAGNLRGVSLGNNTDSLEGWDFSDLDVTDAKLRGSLTDADFSNALVTGTTFNRRISAEQLYSTASYRNRDLQGVNFQGSTTGWDFKNQNLTNAIFGDRFRDADFTDATIIGARFLGGSPTEEQLYSTASYKAGNLQGIELIESRSAWNFSGQDLENASFGGIRDPADMTGVDFTNANIAGVDFEYAGGLTAEQIYSTSSYQNRSLPNVHLNGLSSIDLREQDLSDSRLDNLQDIDLRNATLLRPLITDSTDLDVRGTVIIDAFLSGTLSGNFAGTTLLNVRFDSNANLAGSKFADATFDQYTQFPRGFDPLSMGLTLVESDVGDFDADQAVGLSDLVLLEAQLDLDYSYQPPWPTPYDLDKNYTVDNEDILLLVQEVVGATAGDTNLDGRVNMSDFLVLSNNYSEVGSWSNGDFDLNGQVDFTDFLLLVQQYDPATPAAVPEPLGTHWYLTAPLTVGLWFRKRRGSKH